MSQEQQQENKQKTRIDLLVGGFGVLAPKGREILLGALIGSAQTTIDQIDHDLGVFFEHAPQKGHKGRVASLVEIRLKA